ncbi:MAG: hypothetical protein IT290_05210 [Deltaproteobacteria bacterium]|nr:hypothetical protein [Deltaproteobacteria bacterium]
MLSRMISGKVVALAALAAISFQPAFADDTMIQINKDGMGRSKSVVLGTGDAGIRIQGQGSSRDARAQEALRILQENKMTIVGEDGQTVVTDGQGNIHVDEGGVPSTRKKTTMNVNGATIVVDED